MRTDLRQGLPRIPGGAPWPDMSRNTASTVATVEARSIRDELEVATTDRHDLAEQPMEQRPAQEAVAAQVTRRGLPRTAGGDPWPLVPSAQTQVLRAGRSTPATTAPHRSDTADQGLQDMPPATKTLVANSLTPEPNLNSRQAGDEDERVHADDQKVVSAPQSAPSKPAASTAESPSAKDTHIESGTKPKVRGHNQRSRVLLLRGAVLAILGIALVLFARLLTSLDGVQAFLDEYPGEYELPSWAPTGIPTWLAWQHFFNVFLIVLIVKTGLQIRGERKPPAYWASRRKKDPRKISVTIWFHQAMDLLWVTNGFLFVILLFGTGQWIRIVPSSLEVFPNALSALLQYISLDWPTENGWVNYNSLQQLSYFTTVFVAAPLAVLTGIRMSHLWPAHPQSLSRIYRIELARAIHFPVMLYFCAFTVVHVLLVLMTGALRNLNHMYGGQDSTSWTGFWILLASLVVIVGGFFAARPLITTSIASLFGKVSR